MKTRSFATLVFFLISLAIFSIANGLAIENSDTSTAKQADQPEWWGWGRPRPWGRPHPWGHPHPWWSIPGRGGALPPLPSHKPYPWGRPHPWWPIPGRGGVLPPLPSHKPHPWGHPLPKWPIPGRGGALPPLPSHKFPPLPPKGTGTGPSNTEEQVEIVEQVGSIEQEDDVYQPEWFGHPYIPRVRRPYYPHPRPGFGIYPRPGLPRPYHPIPRHPFPGWGAHPPQPSHH